jgi:histone demethylase JARID1
MDKVILEVKKVEEWLNQCHRTLFQDGNNSSLLSALVKVGFDFRVCSSVFSLKNTLANLFSPFR